MIKILSVDTATEICSVSLTEEGKNIGYKESKIDYSHSSILTELIEEVLTNSHTSLSSLDALAVNGGPGSYTGLRIGVSTVKGLCFGLNIPIIAIDSTEIIANGLIESFGYTDVLYAGLIDARRMEVYAGIYNKNLTLMEEIQPYIIDQDSFDIILRDHKVIFGGNGAEKCKRVINHTNATFTSNIKSAANYMDSIAFKYYQEKKFEDVVYYEPNYLKGVYISKSNK